MGYSYTKEDLEDTNELMSTLNDAIVDFARHNFQVGSGSFQPGGEETRQAKLKLDVVVEELRQQLLMLWGDVDKLGEARRERDLHYARCERARVLARTLLDGRGNPTGTELSQCLRAEIAAEIEDWIGDRKILSTHTESEEIARAFHEAYEQLAPTHGYETRKASAKPWSDVPEQNKKLMIATVEQLIMHGVVVPGVAAMMTTQSRLELFGTLA